MKERTRRLGDPAEILGILGLASRQAVAASRKLDDECPSASADRRHSGCRVVARAGATPSATNGQMITIAVAGPRAAFAADVGSISVGSDIVISVAWCGSAAPLTALATVSTMATMTGRFGRLLVSSSSNRNRKPLFDPGLPDALPWHHAIIDRKVVADVVSRLSCLLHGNIFCRVGSV